VANLWVIDYGPTQRYRCVVIPDLDSNGLLPPGIHQATWKEFVERFGRTAHRIRLLTGLRAALEALRSAGCEAVYLNGSFVTAKEVPGDFDGCWDMTNVDPTKLDPVMLTFDRGRAAQKAKYLGELFPASMMELGSSRTFLDFQQIDKDTGNTKGIVALDLRRLDDD
jgi:hypothetical protein